MQVADRHVPQRPRTRQTLLRKFHFQAMFHCLPARSVADANFISIQKRFLNFAKHFAFAADTSPFLARQRNNFGKQCSRNNVSWFAESFKVSILSGS